MASKISLKNGRSELSIVHRDRQPAKTIYTDGLTNAVDTIADMEALITGSDTSAYDGTTVFVKDLDRGGSFIYDSTKVSEDNQGTNFNGWIRQYDGDINIKWFGAKDTLNPLYINYDSVDAINAATIVGAVTVPEGVFYASSDIKQINSIVGSSVKKSIIKCAGNGITMHQQNKVELSNLTITCLTNRKASSCGVNSTYLSTHQSVFKNLSIENFETNIIVDSWNNEFNNITSNNAKYGILISSKTGSASNLIRIYNSSFYHSDIGININPSEPSYNIAINGCDVENNKIGLYSNNAKALSINNVYFENNSTTCFSLNNLSVNLQDVKYDNFKADNCKLLIGNFVKYNDMAAHITNSNINFNSTVPFYRFLSANSNNNNYINTSSNELSMLESCAYFFGGRYSSPLSVSMISGEAGLINNRDGYAVKITRTNADTPGATGIYFPIPDTVEKTKVYFRIRARGLGRYKFVNSYSDDAFSQFQNVELNETEYSDVIIELDTSTSSHNVVGISFSHNTNDYIVVDSVAIGGGSIPSFNSEKLDYRNNFPLDRYNKLGDKIYNKDILSDNVIGWVCTTAGTPGAYKAFGLIDNASTSLILSGSSTDTLNLTNATSISVPNIATSADDVSTGQLYSDSGTIKIK